MTKIEWTDITINPIVGCTKISPGCQHCYAETMAKRLKAMGMPQYQTVVNDRGWTGQIAFRKPALEQIQKAPAGSKIFIGSMGDIFHENVPFEWIYEVYKAMLERPECKFQILTKRSARMVNFYWHLIHGCAGHKYDPIPRAELSKNIWLGVTCENQGAADVKVYHLSQLPAAKRFVSIEPMISPVELTAYRDGNNYLNWLSGRYSLTRPVPQDARIFAHGYARFHPVDWVICGAETGPKRRPCLPGWIDNIIEQCWAAGTPLFIKQIEIDGRISKDISEWPQKYRVRSFSE